MSGMSGVGEKRDVMHRPALAGGVLALLLSILVLALGFAAPLAAASSPVDSDGDALPDEWEAAPAAATPMPSPIAPPVVGHTPGSHACLRHSKGNCGSKCKKGGPRRRRKCKKKHPPRHRHPQARASGAPTSLAALGASPSHKDIFVQIDYASAALRQDMSCGDLDAIVAAFANAPVSNPDGRTGIDLHIDAGISCPGHSYDLGGSHLFSAGACPGVGATLLSTELPESRVGAFHLAGFSPTCGGGGEGGAATLHGTKMVVFTDGGGFAHVLMHELGHNLGLDHPFPGQPNRLSSMNTPLYFSSDGNGSDEALDYQRVSLPALDEHALSEAAGISAPPEDHDFYVIHYCAGEGTFRNEWPATGPIDWNCNSSPFPWEPRIIDPGTVSADVNGDGQLTVLPATGPEWPTLDYASGGQIGPR